MKGDQRDAKFRAVNPMMAIPALVDGDGPALFESLAIIEYHRRDASESAAAAERAEGARPRARAGADRGRRLASVDRAARARISQRTNSRSMKRA